MVKDDSGLADRGASADTTAQGPAETLGDSASTFETLNASLDRLAVQVRDLQSERDALLAALRDALERIEEGSMEQVNEHGQPTRLAKATTNNLIARIRAAITRATS